MNGINTLRPIPRHFRRLRQLSLQEWLLLARAVPLIAAVRLGLRLLALRTLRRWLARSTRPRTSYPLGEHNIARYVWAVEVAGALVPGATCLARALALQALLARRGVDAELRIGLDRSAGSAMQGHAWLEREGRVLIGDNGIERWTPLESFGGRLEAP